MTCRRAFDVDLAAYVTDPRAAEWTEFRDHWPRCADCAAEVAAWTALQARLDAAHPDPEVLLRWADGDDALPAARRLAVARHVEACAACTDELRALARFDARPPVEAAAARAAPAPRRWTLRRVLWNPALAYALLLLALLPTLTQRHEEAGRGVPAPEPVEQGPRDGEADHRAARKLAAPAGRGDDAVGSAAPAPTARPAPAAETKAKEEPVGRQRALRDAPSEPAPVLGVPVPDAARAAGVVELRVRDAAGDRELRERRAVPADLAELSFALPPSWPRHATYEVELHVPGAGVVARRTVTVP